MRYVCSGLPIEASGEHIYLRSSTFGQFKRRVYNGRQKSLAREQQTKTKDHLKHILLTKSFVNL